MRRAVVHCLHHTTHFSFYLSITYSPKHFTCHFALYPQLLPFGEQRL